MPDQRENHSSFENMVILTALLLGFLGSIMLYYFDAKPILVAIFLGTGISSLVYRFLGGTSGNSMQIGAMKFTGTVAVLIGSAWVINQQLYDQKKDDVVSEVTFEPPSSKWIALDARGEPVDFVVNGTGQTIKIPEINPWMNLPLLLKRRQDGKFEVTTSGPKPFQHGVLENITLHNAGLFTEIKKSDKYIVSPRLPPFSSVFDFDPIPLKIATKKYSGDYSRYDLLDKNDSIIWAGSIYRKRFEIIELEKRLYFLAVVEVNHEYTQQDSMYAKFAIAELIKSSNY